MSVVSHLIVFFAASLPADVGSAEPAALNVSVDWSRISDDLVGRCKLKGLESLLLQGLVDGGFAVVRDAGSSGIRARLAETATSVVIEADLPPFSERRTIALLPRCDSSLQLDLVFQLVEIAKSLRRQVAPDEASRWTPASPVVQVNPVKAIVPAPSREWQLAVGPDLAGLVDLLLRLHVARRLVTLGDLSIRGTLSLAIARPSGILIAEPGLATHLLWYVGDWSGLRIHIGAGGGLYAQWFWDERGNGGYVDERLEVPLEIAWQRFSLLIMPYARRVAAEHTLGGKRIFATDFMGIATLAAIAID
jgi:hypothetical protein